MKHTMNISKNLEVIEFIKKLKTNDNIKIFKPNKEYANSLLSRLPTQKEPVLATIFSETGGILLHNNWLRILGSGSKDFSRDLISWNNGKLEKAILIADDVIGGYFAINLGKFDGEIGHIYYFAHDSLTWQNLNITYAEFFMWALSDAVDLFYKKFRWNDWHKNAKDVEANEGISLYPFLWTNDCNLESCSKKVVGIDSLWDLHSHFVV